MFFTDYYHKFMKKKPKDFEAVSEVPSFASAGTVPDVTRQSFGSFEEPVSDGNTDSQGSKPESGDTSAVPEENMLKSFLFDLYCNFKHFWAIATDHRVNKKIYFVLALFFGALGFHRFYAKHYLSGILYLSLFFIGFLLNFVHGIGKLVIVPMAIIALLQGVWVLCKRSGVDGKVEV